MNERNRIMDYSNFDKINENELNKMFAVEPTLYRVRIGRYDSADSYNQRFVFVLTELSEPQLAIYLYNAIGYPLWECGEYSHRYFASVDQFININKEFSKYCIFGDTVYDKAYQNRDVKKYGNSVDGIFIIDPDREFDIDHLAEHKGVYFSKNYRKVLDILADKQRKLDQEREKERKQHEADAKIANIIADVKIMSDDTKQKVLKELLK